MKKHLIYCFVTFLLITNSYSQNKDNNPLNQGRFFVGCNYWASYSGIRMWQDFRPEVIEKDFKQLSDNGMKILRVFPLWPDFQPIHQIYSANGSRKYIAFKDEQPLPPSGVGANGMSEEQLQHFEVLANLAQKYKLKLVVGLITGWMSGRLYIPPAMEGRDILTDPESLTWQHKFVTTFVNRFKNKPAIIAWDFGNECNVMQNISNHNQAYVWSAMLSGAIKSEDQTRPILSGMHSLEVEENGKWRIIDQAANVDILTTHPYSLWTKYASQDPINSMRTILHGVAETRMYGDIGGKPAMVEETGVMGPMTGGEKEKAAFARTALFSNWAHGYMGNFWWCAYDQLSFKYPPYNYSSVEAELGLIKEDRTPKPVMNEMRSFSEMLDKLPFQALPPHKTEAVCILTEGQDNWAVAYSSFILAKQAGFDFQFQKAGQELKEAPLYLLPSIKGIDPVFKDYWFKLLEKVKSGATLYVSLDDAYLPTLTEPLGIDISVNIKRRNKLHFISKALGDSLNFEAVAERKLIINPLNNKVLSAEEDGNPVFIKCTYGKGSIYLLTFPLENNLASMPGAFDKGEPAYSNIYKEIARPFIDERVLQQNNSGIGTTEHTISSTEKLVTLINYTTTDIIVEPKLKSGYSINKSLYGKSLEDKNLTIKANDALVLSVLKK